MNLFLVRHGDAVGSDIDPERPLSDTGRTEIQRLGAYLRTQSVAMDGYWHSDKLRAKQTAELLAEVVGGEIEERRGIAPNDDPVPIAAELDAWPDENLCIVTHLPFVSQLASQLLASNTAAAWNFGTGSMLCLSREATGRWWAEWFLGAERLPFV